MSIDTAQKVNLETNQRKRKRLSCRHIPALHRRQDMLLLLGLQGTVSSSGAHPDGQTLAAPFTGQTW
jgi:hypothetical protein